MDYFRPRQYNLDQLRFTYLGVNYKGRGFLAWDQADGYKLEAVVDPEAGEHSGVFEMGRPGIIPEDAYRSIRARDGATRILIPSIALIDRSDVLSHRRLSVGFETAFFLRPNGLKFRPIKWSGKTLLSTSDYVVLPDPMESNAHIAGYEVSRLHTLGLNFQEGDTHVLGMVRDREADDRTLELRWVLPRDGWTRGEAWAWPDAAALALGMLTGQHVQVMRREALFGPTSRVEMRKRVKSRHPGLLPRIIRVLEVGKSAAIDKAAFFKLTEFLAKNRREGRICRNIHMQLVEGWQQRNTQVMQLLISGIMEAVVRNIHGTPFRKSVKGQPKYYFDVEFRKFCARYFPAPEWSTFPQRFLDARALIRHRNAHPDWLLAHGGNQPLPEAEDELDALIFVSRFYHYVILALAGFPDLKPCFPAPHKQWGPGMTLTKGAVAEGKA